MPVGDDPGPAFGDTLDPRMERVVCAWLQVRPGAPDGSEVFGLRFSNEGHAYCDGEYEALLTIGEFGDGFCASGDVWSRDEYRAQWLRCAEALLAEDGTRSAMITSLYDPLTANWIVWWPMYRTGTEVAIYNQMCFLDGWERSSDVEDLFVLLVQEHEYGRDSDQPMSRWTTTLAEVDAFAVALRTQMGR